MAVSGKERSNYVKIDEKQIEKLREVARKKNITMGVLDESLGHARGFLKQCMYNGYINKSDLMLIKLIYDVDVECHEPKPIEKEQSKQVALNVDELVTVIRANNVIGKHLEEQNNEIIKLLGEIKDKLKIIANIPYGTNTQTPHTYKNYTGIKDGKLQFTTKEEKK